MHSMSRLLLAAALALVALSAFATTAGAASFSITPGGAITATSLGLLTFTAPSIGGKITCRLTLRGRLNTGLLPKTAGTEFGSITEGTSATSCNPEGEYQPLVEPNAAWRLNYNTILGTLPNNVTSVLFNLEAWSFIDREGGIECLYESKPQGVLLEVSFATEALYLTGLLRVLRKSIPKHSGSVLCPAVEIIGSLGLTPTQTLKRL